MVRGQPVGDQRVPVVHRPAKVLKKRDAIGRAEAAVSVMLLSHVKQ